MLRSKARLAEVGAKRSRGGRMLATHAAKRLAVPKAPRTQPAAATPSRCLSKSCSCTLCSEALGSSRPACSCACVAPPPFRRLLILQVGGREPAGYWQRDGSRESAFGQERVLDVARATSRAHPAGALRDMEFRYESIDFWKKRRTQLIYDATIATSHLRRGTSEEAAARITGITRATLINHGAHDTGRSRTLPICTRGSLIHMTTPSLADRVPSVASCGTSEQRKVDVREPEVHLTTKIDISAHLIR